MTRAGIVFALVLLAALGAGRSGGPAFAVVGFLATPRPVAPSEMVGAVPVTVTIRNDGDVADVLLGGKTAIADRVEVHSTRLIDGQRAMERTPAGITILPDTTLVLEPGSHHLMVIGLRQALVQGNDFSLTLRFAHAGEVPIDVRVHRKVDAAGLTPIPPVTIGDLSVSLASAPPAPGGVLSPSAELGAVTG